MKGDGVPLLLSNLRGDVVEIYKSRGSLIHVTPAPGPVPGEMVLLGNLKHNSVSKHIAGELLYDAVTGGMRVYGGNIWRAIGNGS